MICKNCNGDSKVLETRYADKLRIVGFSGVRRRRECLKCKHRFTTYETEVLLSDVDIEDRVALLRAELIETIRGILK